MTWVRGPWWDGCWLLSGVPIVIILSVASLWIPTFYLFAVGVIVFQTAHSLSPIVLAWGHVGYCTMMLRRPWKFVGVPAVILLGAVVLGIISTYLWPMPGFNPITLRIVLDSYWNPLWGMAAVYGTWNIYHFGMQNFGVMSIYRQRRGGYTARQRRADLVFCCLTAWATMSISFIHYAANYLRFWVLGYYQILTCYAVVAICAMIFMIYLEWRSLRLCLPRIVLILSSGIMMAVAMLFHPMIGLGIISFNHWLSAIGLAAHVSTRPAIFPIVVVLGGTLLFCLLFVRGWEIPTHVAAVAIAIRLAIGNVHFLYDRWVWKLSDPRVRATIGKGLFA